MILGGEFHSTVVCVEERLVFDLLLYDDQSTDIIEFALRTSPPEPDTNP